MDDDTLQKISDEQSSNDRQDNNSDSRQAFDKPKPSYGFMTPSEAGYRETDPMKLSAAPRPQPGMTFTPTGGSVSSINHQLNRQTEADDEPPQNPEQTQ